MSKPTVFEIGGRLVNASGQEVDKSGKVMGAAVASAGDGDLQAKLDAAQQEAQTLKSQVESLTHERDEARGVGQAAERLQLEAQGKLDAMTKERDDLQAKLDAVKVVPDNAVELIASVKGISEDMAKKALDALTSGKPDSGK